jgi:hypothetical protein
MKVKVKIPINPFVKDLRSGATDLALMQKYGFQSAITLHKVIRNLLVSGTLSASEVKSRLPEGWKIWGRDSNSLLEQRKEVEITIRKAQRSVPFGRLCVDDSGDFCEYQIIDISEAGLKLRPIQAHVGETRQFKIHPKELDDVGAMSFSAECRWTDGSTAGFFITDITPNSLRELQKLIRLFTFEDF